MEDIRDEDDIIRTVDGLIFNPYNPQNVEIKMGDIQSILTRYNIPPTVTNLELYKRAFVHKSYTKRPVLENLEQHIVIVDKPPDCIPLKTKSNERLEFLGDGVLECVAKYMLYRRFPKGDEGFMTDKKIAIVKNEAIGRVALEMGLHKWLILSRNAEEKKIRTNLKRLGCLFEAFIGALFLDFNKLVVRDEDGWFQSMFVTGPGFQMAQKFIENVFEKHIDWVALIQVNDNYKNILQIKIQKEFKVTPHYLEISRDSETGFKMGVYLCLGQPIHSVKIEDAIDVHRLRKFDEIREHVTQHFGKIFLFLGEGQHKIKRKAEQIACNEALQYLETITPAVVEP